MFAMADGVPIEWNGISYFLGAILSIRYLGEIPVLF